MAYRIRKNKPIEKSICIVALEQIDKAIAEITDKHLDRHETVHQVRKRCKKLRALIRLVRPEFQEYQRENAFFRDAARKLSKFRDAQSMIECFDDLNDYYQHQMDPDAFQSIRLGLTQRRQTMENDVESDIEQQLSLFLTQMRAARERVRHWKIDADGFLAVAGGLTKTYRRGRRGLRRAYKHTSPENFHEWRKRIKYHWYHTRLLRRIWPEMMKVARHTSDELSDLLGSDHDLTILRQTLVKDSVHFDRDTDLQRLLNLIDGRRTQLQTLARTQGERLFADKPKPYRARLASYWDTWQQQ